MPAFDFLAQLRSTLPPAEIRTLVSRIKTDPLVWASLENEPFFMRACEAAKISFKNWSPATLSLAAIRQDLSPELFIADLSKGPEDAILQAGLKLFQETRRAGREPRSLAEAGLLAVALRQHWKLEHTWKGLLSQLSSGNEPDWKHFKVWRTAIACLYGMVPDPLDMLRGLIGKRFSPVATAWALHSLASNPLSDLEFSQALYNLVITLPPLQQIAWLRFVNTQGHQKTVELVARQILARVPVAVSASLAAFDTGGQDLESLFLRFLEIQRLAGLYQLTNQPANSQALIRRAHKALDYWETGLGLQQVELSAQAGESLENGLNPTLAEQITLHQDLQQELVFANQESITGLDAANLLSDNNPSPFVQIQRAAILGRAGQTPEAMNLARGAFERLAGFLAESPYYFLPSFVYDWRPLHFIQVYFDLGLVAEGLQLAEIFASLRPEDLELLELVSVTHEQRGSLDKALASAELLAAFDAENPAWRRRLGLLYGHQEEWNAAYLERKTVLSLAKPPLAEDWVAFGLAASKIDAWDEVQSACEKALEINPELGLAYALIGQVNQQQGRLDEANRMYLQSTLLSPDDPYGWLSLAGLFVQTGNFDKALETLRAAVLAIPDSAEINFSLAQACLKQGYLADALPYLRKAAEIAPDSLDASLELGKSLYSLGRLDEAEIVLRKAHNRWTKNPNLAYAYALAALAVNDQPNALSALEIAIQKENPEPEWLILFAETLLEASPCTRPEPPYSSSSLNSARLALEKVIARDSTNFKAHLLAAETLVAQGRLEEASQEYEHLVEFPEAGSNSYRWRMQAGIGNLALKQGQVAKSLAALQEAIQDQPENVGLHRLLAEAFQAGSLVEDAVRMARHALKLAPDDLQNLAWYAGIMVELKEPAEALHALNIATQLDPLCPANWLSLARLQVVMGDPAAQASLDRMLGISQLSSADLRGAAKIFIACNQFKRAQDCLERAVSSSQPAAIETLLEAIYVAQRLGLFEKGLDLTQKALNLCSEDPALYTIQSDFLVELNRPEAALACLEHSQQLLGSGGMEVFDGWVKVSGGILDEKWIVRMNDPAALHFRMACLYRQAGNPAAAYQHIQTACSLHPEWVTIKVAAADLAMALLQNTQASEITSTGNEISDPLAEFLAGMDGKAELAAIRAELALLSADPQVGVLIGAGILIQPDSPRLLAARARWEFSQGRLSLAEADFQQAARAARSIGNTLSVPGYRGFTTPYWLLQAAIDTWNWDEADRLAEGLVKDRPNEPLAHLLQAEVLASTAEMRHLLVELKVTTHLPAESCLNDACYEAFEKAIQNASRLGASLEIDTWKMIGRAVFRPTTQNLRSLASLLPSPLAAEYLIPCLRWGGNLAGSIQVSAHEIEIPAVHIQLALSYLQMDAEKGLAIIRPVCSSRPWDVLGAITHAILARQLELQPEALEALEAALEIWPAEVTWQAWAGELASQLGDRSCAVAHWEKACGLLPDHFPYLLALGSAYLMNGQSAHAIAALEKATQVDGQRVEGWYLLAQAERISGDYEEALRCALHAGDLEPGSVDPLLLCGEISLDMGRLAVALDYAQNAWALDASNDHTLQFYIQVLVQAGQRDEALKLIDQLSATDVSLPVMIERARLVNELRGPLEALGVLNRLVVQAPDNLEILGMLAQVQAETGDEIGAERTAEEALKLQPENASLNLLVGKIQKKVGNLDKAVHYISEAIRQQPSRMESYLDLAVIYLERREPNRALETYQKAILVNPEDHRAYFQAAQVLRDGRDYIGAETMLRKAVELAPEDVNIRRQLGAVITLNLIHNSQEAITSHESYRS